ncbi:hypothetical protein [Streptomyces ureilyticus]|uniref:Uncharacterized protein n=1 Tax=Streptomyces ureilyticus TaxID=1775131 RepID=A0ABX0DVH8_9ACTN|nr:hypothetical protein [Streptomyces ureilyticus]NGO45925.1 hypothetical protein [Streptomyces ureilyticus]
MANHWSDHKAEFPELSSAKQYVELAPRYRSVADSPAPPAGYRVWDRVHNNGNSAGYVVYEMSTNTLVSYDADGVPKTMNRPAPRSPNNPRGFRTDIWPWLRTT